MTFIYSTFTSVVLVNHPASGFESPPARSISSLTSWMLTKRGFENSPMYHLKRKLWITDRINTAIRVVWCPSYYEYRKNRSLENQCYENWP